MNETTVHVIVAFANADSAGRSIVTMYVDGVQYGASHQVQYPLPTYTANATVLIFGGRPSAAVADAAVVPANMSFSVSAARVYDFALDAEVNSMVHTWKELRRG